MRIAPSAAARWENGGSTMTTGDEVTCSCFAMCRLGCAGSVGEKYFEPSVLKKMDESFHNVFERHQQPDQMLDVPAVNF